MSWLADVDGILLVPSPTCAGFTVRFWPPSARGPGTPLRDATGSSALIVPTHVTAEQFRELVGNRPGRYVLSQVSTTRKPLRAPAAVVVLDAAIELDAAIGTSALATILAAVDAAEQRTAATLAQLADQLVDHRTWIEHELASLRDALQEVDARSILSFGSRMVPTPTTPATPPRTVAMKPGRPRPKPATAPRTPAPAAPQVATTTTAAMTAPPTTTATTAPHAAPTIAAPTSSLAPPPTIAAPALSNPTQYVVTALFHEVSHELALAENRVALLEIIETLPPLPRAVFNAMAQQGSDEQLAPLLHVVASQPLADTAAVFTHDATLMAPIQASLATSLAIPIDEIRAAWSELDEQRLPPRLRDAITAMRG